MIRTKRLYVKDEQQWNAFKEMCEHLHVSMSDKIAAFMEAELQNYREALLKIDAPGDREAPQKSPLIPQGPEPLLIPRDDSEDEQAKAKKKPQNAYEERALQVLAYINQVAKKRLNTTGLIPQRLRDGATVEECCLQIDWLMRNRTSIWIKDHLNQITPFRKDHFDRNLESALREREETTKGRGSPDMDTMIQRLAALYGRSSEETARAV